MLWHAWWKVLIAISNKQKARQLNLLGNSPLDVPGFITVNSKAKATARDSTPVSSSGSPLDPIPSAPVATEPTPSEEIASADSATVESKPTEISPPVESSAAPSSLDNPTVPYRPNPIPHIATIPSLNASQKPVASKNGNSPSSSSPPEVKLSAAVQANAMPTKAASSKAASSSPTPVPTLKPEPKSSATATKSAALDPNNLANVALSIVAGPANSASAQIESQSIAAHNSFREKYGAPPMTWDPALASAAQSWANKCKSDQSLLIRLS